MSNLDIVIIGAALIAFALLSGRLAGTALTAPMVFVALGLLVGPELLDLVELDQIGYADLGLLAEVTLALVLFTDATALDTRRLRREDSMPIRLLGLALPMSIVLGAVVAIVAFPELVVFEAVALAILLAPTDAALGQVVVSDDRIPSVVRQGLNVESGLNDGVCVPLLLGAVALAEIEESRVEASILVDLVRELGIAVGIGIAVAVFVATLVRHSAGRGWIDGKWNALVPLVTAVVAYVATAEAGGSGFIASFVAGLVYGRLLGAAAHESTELTEDIGQLLSAVTFFLFGAVLLGGALTRIDVATVLYAVVSLTAVRIVPVALALVGTGARPPTRWFTGWFGPRGLATIVFALTIIDTSGLSGATRIVDVATITVMVSVFAHGASAAVLSARYVRWVEANQHDLPYETEAVEIGSHVRASQRSLLSPLRRSDR